MGYKYTKEYLINELKRFYDTHGRIPKSRELSNKNGYPNWISYRSYFGSLRNALKEAGLSLDTFRIRPKRYSNVTLIKLLLKFKKEFGRYPLFSDLNKRGNVIEYPHVRTYEFRFGSLNNAIIIAKEVEYDDEHRTASIKTLAKEVIETNEFFKLGKFNLNKETVKLTLNEINHIIVALKGIHCDTCKNARTKLMNKKKELLNETNQKKPEMDA